MTNFPGGEGREREHRKGFLSAAVCTLVYRMRKPTDTGQRNDMSKGSSSVPATAVAGSSLEWHHGMQTLLTRVLEGSLCTPHGNRRSATFSNAHVQV